MGIKKMICPICEQEITKEQVEAREVNIWTWEDGSGLVHKLCYERMVLKHD